MIAIILMLIQAYCEMFGYNGFITNWDMVLVAFLIEFLIEFPVCFYFIFNRLYGNEN